MGAPRVVIVDDHTLLTEALRRLLEPDCEVVGTYDDPRAFLRDVAPILNDRHKELHGVFNEAAAFAAALKGVLEKIETPGLAGVDDQQLLAASGLAGVLNPVLRFVNFFTEN